MRTVIHEKFEVTIFNPATRQFEGGSYHAEIEVEGALTKHTIKLMQDVVDQFDHSTVVPSHLISKDEVAKISQRYTVIDDATDFVDMLAGIARTIVSEIAVNKIEIEELLSITFYSDNFDAKYIFQLSDLDKVSIEDHKS